VIVTVELIVEGIPLFDEEFEPILNPFEFADDLIFADTYLGGSNDFIVGIKNGGTEALEIEGYDFSGDNAAAFSTDMDDKRILDPAEEYEFTVTLAPEALREDGEMHSCTFHMYSNAMNDDLEEDGHVWWDFFGQAQVPPAAYIVCDDFEEIAEDQWAIEMDMLIGDEPRHVPFIIGNEAGEGRDNLDWFIDIEEVEEEERDASSRTLRTTRSDADGPRRDDPGDILAIFDWPRAPSQSPTFAWNRDTGMMLASTYQGWIDIVDPSDPENPEVIESIQPGLGSQNDCAWLDGIFYICIAGQGRCARFDNNMDRLDGDLQIVANAYGIAADPVNEWFFAKDAWNQNRMHVYAGVVDGELGDELGVVDNYRQYTNNQDPWTINWVPEHENGEFWCHTPSGGGIMSVDIDTEEWTAIEQTYRWADPVANGNWLNGVGHDAYNVWIGISGQNRIWIFDDGIDEVYINWVAVEPDEGITEPGAESELDMIFSTADMEVNFVEYEANVMINTNDPQHEVIVINCKLSVGTRLQNFVDFDETDRVHNILVEDVIFMEESVPVGWEVGVFTEDDVLAGGIVWRADMGETILPAYGATDNHDYFEGGEDFTFKIFDPEAGEDGVEYDWGNAAFTDGPNRWVNNGNSSVVLSFQPVVDQIVHFNDGWNLVSLNIIPVPEFWIDDDGPDTELMCTYGFWDDEEEAWSLEQMKDEHGEFCAPDWGFWGIFYWLPFEGYQLKVVGDRDVTWMGSPIDAQADLAGLGAGWNMMAYYPNYVLPCEFIDDNHEDNFYVLGEIIDRVVIAKDGNADFCMPAWDYSGMADWTGGQGYQINLSEDIEVFNYPLELVEQAAMPGRKVKSLGESHWARLTSTGENMSVLVNSVLGISIDEGDQIASFNLNGDLVGTGMFTNGKCGIGVWGDDIRTDQTDGMLEAEEFVLKLWDADRQLVVDLSVGVVQVGVVNAEGGLEYKRDGILVLDVKVDEAMPTEFSLGQNYPNPFNSTTRMAYEVPELSNVSIQVFDLTGRHVTTLVSEEHHAGRYTAVWEARDITSGIYIVRMKAANFTSVRKVMLVK
ncbi:MAG: T9SS type A sorting domain-containing protein, partial [Calditrichaeota bacterium]|nr:T9SS type A sorting domain-containing protein [Calditrichota bacterium]